MLIKISQEISCLQAMDQFGNVSEPYVHEGCMDSETYLKQCIMKRLIPFIKNYHCIENVVFWFNLSMIHYAKKLKTEIEKNIWMLQAKLGKAPGIDANSRTKTY